MTDSMKKQELEKSAISDMEFITGGAAVVENINNNLLQTFSSQKCNCSLYQPHTTGVNLNICDNCKWAQAPYEGSEITFCSKQIT